MTSLINGKKAAELGFKIVVGLIILLISGGVIIWFLQSSASKADEKTQVNFCRTTNEVRVGTEKYSHWYMPIHSPRICNTIFKTETDAVPAKDYEEKYVNAKEAAEAEVADMIKNCWYMWLEGSSKLIFPETGPFYWGGGKGCHVCYVFKIKKEAKGFTFDGLLKLMKERTYRATIPEGNNCDPPNGGKWVTGDTCPAGQTVVKKDFKKARVCCRKDVRYECENKGGICYVPIATASTPPGYSTYKIYDEWSCPKANERCYVSKDYYYSYFDYITSYGAGSIEHELDFAAQDYNPTEEVLAISFYSNREEDNPSFIKFSSLNLAINGDCSVGQRD